MTIIRKKKVIDGMDRTILRRLYNNGNAIHLSGSAIAKYVNLTPPAINPRLRNLQEHGIIKPMRVGGMRNFTRVFGDTKKSQRVQAPSSIFWGLDLKQKKRK